jgi:PBP1b-binding outer membrane lipoprotein LpoB
MNQTMKTLNQNLGSTSIAIFGIVLISVIAGCSSESEKDTRQSNQPEQTQSNSSSKASELSYSFDHPHDEAVTNMEKHKFQHAFADQCIEREIRRTPEAKNNRKSLEKTCMCIAEYMMKDLTVVEAEKFLDQKKNPRSLQIRFNNAAYFCSKKQ